MGVQVFCYLFSEETAHGECLLLLRTTAHGECLLLLKTYEIPKLTLIVTITLRTRLLPELTKDIPKIK